MKNSNSSVQAERDRAFFDEISEKYERKDRSPSARPARKQRLEQTLFRCGGVEGKHLLEIGCGSGYAADYLANSYGSYVGVDHSEALIHLAEKRWEGRSERVSFQCLDAKEMSGDRQFDGIFMIGVLHHMEEPGETLRKLCGHLGEGGWIAVNEPSSRNPLIQWLRYLRKRSDPAYSNEQETYRAEELQELLLEAGFTEVAIHPQGLFSTPFAEVPLRPGCLFAPLARAACAVDRFLEKRLPCCIRPLAWNWVAIGGKPVRTGGKPYLSS